MAYPTGDSCFSGTFTAGSAACSPTITIGATSGLGIIGIPVSFSTDAYSAVSAASQFTGASGKTTVTFTPTNLVAHTPSVLTVSDGVAGLTSTIAIAASTPASICFSFTAVCGGLGSVAFPSTHYVTAHVTISSVNYADIPTSTIYFTVADRFGNPDAGGVAGPSAVFTALSGGGFFAGSTTTTSETVAAASGAFAFEYSQAGAFNTIGLIGVTLTGTYGGPAFSVSGNTGQISTSTFDGASNLPTVVASSVIAPGCGVPATASCQAAGKTATVSFGLTLVQSGVPVELSLDGSSTAVNANGGFSGSKHTTVYTGSTGVATATYTVDTGSGALAIFNANVTAPTDATSSTHVLGTSGPSTGANQIDTIAGAPSTFVITVCFVTAAPPCLAANTVGSGITASSTAYVAVSISDAYGNAAVNPGPNNIQISLSAPGSVLSATSVYIVVPGSSTYPTFGWIAWTMPSTVGTALTLTASGVLNGATVTATKSTTTVSAMPTFNVKSPAPLSGVIYSNSPTVVFNGKANASLGYASSVTIASIGYKVGTNPWKSAPIVAGNKIIWSLAATFSSGLGTIMFNATDSKGNVFVSQSYTVLVDASAPTITASSTTAYSVGTPVTFTIVDSMGDLNAASVTASSNSSATLTTTVTGTNSPGSSVTYTVSVAGLPSTTGHWSVTLNANDLAGNAATAVTAIVKVTVAFAQSLVISGTPTSSVVGSYTGVSATYTNYWSSSQNVIVFAVWKNSLGQTVYISAASATMAAGASQAFFLPEVGLASGPYSVQLSVWTTTNNPVSAPTTLSVTV